MSLVILSPRFRTLSSYMSLNAGSSAPTIFEAFLTTRCRRAFCSSVALPYHGKRVCELDTDCEVLWVNLKCADSKDLLIGAYYRPNEGDALSYANFETSVTRACGEGNSRLIVAGDFNFPDCNWSDMTSKKDSNYPVLHRRLYDFLYDCGIDQLVLRPTRGNNTLDLVLTNTPYLIPRVETGPGLSDHDTVYFEYASSLLPANQTPRPVSIYKKADWDGMRQTLQNLACTMQKQHDEKFDPEDMWIFFQNNYEEIFKKNIPTKILKKKITHPWISVEIKKLIKTRDRKYRKMLKSGSKVLAEEVKALKREIRQKTRRAHWD